MKRVHVFCEGPTEETFLRELLLPYFYELGIILNPIVIRTSSKGKGGATSYGKIKWQIQKKCKEDTKAFVTTLLDFYGLPADFPSSSATGNSATRVNAMEKAFQDDVDQPNFIAHLILHEFEGLLFSDPSAFGEWFDDQNLVDELSAIRNKVESPEEINDGLHTAPSKRILALCEGYNKVFHGTAISLEIGLDNIRKECPKFNEWMLTMEKLGTI